MKYLFVVQGEGRGHLTQALSLKSMLETNGHEVVSVLVGCSSNRILPDFFTNKINTEIIRFQSPNFLPTPKGKGSPLLVSILYNILLLPVYLHSLVTIRHTIREKQPDVVINFYELMCGLTYGLFNPEPPMINIAHQYYFLTSAFKYTGNNIGQFRLLNFFSKLTALNAHKTLALSFREERKYYSGKIVVVPPLLRKEVLQQPISQGEYIHGYMINSGYADELTAWSKKNPNQSLHFFWDKKNADQEVKLTPSLTLHKLNDVLFLKYMAGAKAYATTGGFESVCEAMYLQKPVLMVPIHIEQECNVIDAMRSGAGVSSTEFDIEKLLNFVPEYTKSMQFNYWTLHAESFFLYELTRFEPEALTVLGAL